MAQMPMSNLNFRTRLSVDVSTAHVSREDMDLFDQWSRRDACANASFVVYTYPHGVFVYLYPSEVSDSCFTTALESATTAGLSPQARNLLRVAREAKGDYLQLDADGEVYKELPQFDW